MCVYASVQYCFLNVILYFFTTVRQLNIDANEVLQAVGPGPIQHPQVVGPGHDLVQPVQRQHELVQAVQEVGPGHGLVQPVHGVAPGLVLEESYAENLQ